MSGLLILLLGLLGSSTAPVPPPFPTWPWPFNWSTVQPFNYGNNGSGYDNAAELLHKKKYKILFTDNNIDNPENNQTFEYNEEAKMSEQVRQYHVAAPYVPAFIYRPGVNIPSSFASSKICNDSAKAGWWMHSATTGEPVPCILNLTNNEAWNFWVNDYISYEFGYDDPHAAGVFIDGGNPGCTPNNFTTLLQQQALFNATVLAWREAAVRLNAKGKVLIVSMRDHFANTSSLLNKSLDHTKITCPYPEDVVFELMDGTGVHGDNGDGESTTNNEKVHFISHREYHPTEVNGDEGPQACAAVIEDWAYEARAASGSLWCTYDINPSQSGLAPFNTSLAMFLLGMEARSYFGASAGYSDFPKPEWHWWFEYSLQLGKPHGAMVKDGLVFKRDFDHAKVIVNCAANTSSIEWIST